MVEKIRRSTAWTLAFISGIALLLVLALVHPAGAINRIPDPDPQPGSFGVQATKEQAPPVEGATIVTPAGGASFTTSPITVNGLCPNELLVQLYNNGVMVGSVMCESGSFSLQVSLFSGANELRAVVYDNLEQAGPDSNTISVSYTDNRLTAFGQLITLTSSYGRRAAAAGSELTWPLQLTGGTGPYAFSINWGDGSAAELKSQSLQGLVTIAHTYKKAGIYQVSIQVTDTNGVSSFLQVIAVASGKVEAAPVAGTTPTTTTTILWIPALLALLLLIPSYWLGRRSQIVSIRHKMLKDREAYAKQEKTAHTTKSATPPKTVPKSA